MSWKPEVLIQGKWSQNNLAFATEREAELSAADLMSRWMLVQNYRAVESDQPVNYKLTDQFELIPVEVSNG